MVEILMVMLAFASGLAAGEGDSAIDVAGVTVVPHVGTPGTLFRRSPIAPLDARVQLFVGSTAPGADESFRIGNVLFDGKEAAEYLKDELWTWHDSLAD